MSGEGRLMIAAGRLPLFPWPLSRSAAVPVPRHGLRQPGRMGRLMRRMLALTMLLGLVPGAVLAEDAAAPGPRQLELDGTSIRGSQELPRVLYILPWQDPGAAELAGRPFNSLIEDVLSPLDRDEFRRELGYREQFNTEQSDTDASSATEPGSGIEEVSRP